MELYKTCRACREIRDRAAFARNASSPDGLRSECRTCRSNADRSYLLRRRFGFSVEDYDTMLAAQGGKCALCSAQVPGGRWTRFHVDHCHDTGRVRGLLCNSCNSALGALGDTEESIAKVLAYVANP